LSARGSRCATWAYATTACASPSRSVAAPTDEVEAAFLVDASGRDALIASRLGRRVPLPDLGKAALFGHYRGARRASGRLEGHLQAYLLDVFFAPRPPATLKDALTTVFAEGAFLEQPLWLRARLERVRLAVRRARWLRQLRGQPVESQLSW
jgi:hypothetical protein